MAAVSFSRSALLVLIRHRGSLRDHPRGIDTVHEIFGLKFCDYDLL